ncbi:hypothetical protein FO519_007965 [Halicephalobus sp. NKZ332]|nr:hypothetical protein FO519_007965 [Halicephalobus sp. NKZ332]
MAGSSSSSDFYVFDRRKHTQDHRTSKPQIWTVEPVSPMSEITDKCYCRFLWNYELHGLTQFLMSTTYKSKFFWGGIIGSCILIAVLTTNMVFREYLEKQKITLLTFKRDKQLLYPTIVVCPKNADTLNYTLVRRDIETRISGMDNTSMNQLIAFAVAGAGFDNMSPAISNFTDADINRVNSYFHRWRGTRSYSTFFRQLFEDFGYSCNKLFDSCYYGSETIDCCKAFKPVYVMLRGRCFQLTNFYQRDPDEVGKLSLSINLLPSPIIDPDNVQSQVVIYISDRFPDIATFPRFYLNYMQWNRMRFQLKEIKMLPTFGQCTDNPNNLGRATCFVNHWIKNKVISKFNCTVFYFEHKAKGVPICDPEVIVRDYNQFVNPSMKGLQCVPPCLRFDTSIEIYTAEDMPTAGYYPINPEVPAFRLEASYTMLTYESYQEVLTTSLQGFISQIGGQFGLFLGLSVITIIQFFFSMSKLLFTGSHIIYRHYTRKDDNSLGSPNGDIVKEPIELNHSLSSKSK